MALQEELKTQGDFLFRYRSYLPLCLLPIFVLAIFTSENYLLLDDGSYNVALIILAIAVGLLGQGIRIWVAAFVPRDTSGRNTKEQKASVLNHTGIYSICRNPLYLGNFFMMLAPIVLLGNWLFCLVFALSFWLYYERIIYAEEAFLRAKFGEEYLKWTEQTPPFLPKLNGYVPSSLGFSLRSMLKREYNSFFGLTTSLFVFHYLIVVLGGVREGNIEFPMPDMILTILFLSSAVFYLTIRILVKMTNLFSVQGR